MYKKRFEHFILVGQEMEYWEYAVGKGRPTGIFANINPALFLGNLM